MAARTVSFALTMLRLCAGKILNAIGAPGVVQPGTYQAGIRQVSVRVALGPLFTVVTVNGIDVYLDRFTGMVDGVGFAPGGSLLEGTPRAACPAPLPATVTEEYREPAAPPSHPPGTTGSNSY